MHLRGRGQTLRELTHVDLTCGLVSEPAATKEYVTIAVEDRGFNHISAHEGPLSGSFSRTCSRRTPPKFVSRSTTKMRKPKANIAQAQYGTKTLHDHT